MQTVKFYISTVVSFGWIFSGHKLIFKKEHFVKLFLVKGNHENYFGAYACSRKALCLTKSYFDDYSHRFLTSSQLLASVGGSSSGELIKVPKSYKTLQVNVYFFFDVLQANRYRD